MKARSLRPLLWPVILLVIGNVIGWAAEYAVGRWQDYGLYGLTRPLADLLILIGLVWLVVAVVRMALARRRR